MTGKWAKAQKGVIEMAKVASSSVSTVVETPAPTVNTPSVVNTCTLTEEDILNMTTGELEYHMKHVDHTVVNACDRTDIFDDEDIEDDPEAIDTTRPVRTQNCGLTGADMMKMDHEDRWEHMRNCTHSLLTYDFVGGPIEDLWVIYCCCESLGVERSSTEAVRVAEGMGCSEVQVIYLPLTRNKWNDFEPDFHYNYFAPLVGQLVENCEISDLWSNLDHDEETSGLTLAEVIFDHRTKSECEECEALWAADSK